MNSNLTYVSTRNKQEPIDFYTAILQGIASDGGLLVPNFDFETLELERLLDLKYDQLASLVLNQFIPEDGHELIEKACQEVYGRDLFNKEVVPVKKVGDIYVAELFQGPTAAFKDMALALLPRLMTISLKMKKEERQVLILAATSGDTGKAALEGFKDVPGTSIKVFYPNDGVSAIQKQQMVTQSGKNVEIIAINGNFDDAQTAVKKAFNDETLKTICDEQGIFLSSANSINIGRLLPQIVYYFHSYLTLVKNKEIQMNDKINFCIPSGNFGNALAGVIASKMGLPVHKFICSSNSNNILTDFFHTGCYDVNREFYKTNAPAMDILISSNLERLVWLLSDRDGQKVSHYMDRLKETGKYEVDEEVFNKTKTLFYAGYSSEKETLEAIKTVYNTSHYILDTHTATGYKVYRDYVHKTMDTTPTVVLATASPYKFPESVYEALTDELCDAYEAIDKLNTLSDVEIPAPLVDLENKKVLFEEVIDKEEIIQFVKERILQG